MAKIVIIGGGWSGIAAAVRARKQGADVTVAEKTDLLLGLGNVGGIMRNNGRYTAAEENIALGAGELFEITDKLSLHKDVDFPGHDHASFYDVLMVEKTGHRNTPQDQDNRCGNRRGCDNRCGFRGWRKDQSRCVHRDNGIDRPHGKLYAPW